MYNIFFTDGNSIKIKGASVNWVDKYNLVRVYDGLNNLVAEFNGANIAGWAKTKVVESEY